MENNVIKTLYPVLVLRGRVMFPHISSLFDVGRSISLYAVEKAMEEHNGDVFVVTQKDPIDDDPSPEAINKVGVLCHIQKLVNVGEKTVRLQLFGQERMIAESLYLDETGKYFVANALSVPDSTDAPIEEKACYSVALDKFKDFISTDGKFPKDLAETIYGLNDYSEFVDLTAFNLPIKETEKQKILETVVLAARLELLAKTLNDLSNSARLEREISKRVKQNVEANQKEYYLREQLKAIHEELGDDESEVETLRDKILAKKMPKEDEEKVLKELDRMSRMSASSPDYAVLRTYVDWILDLPFNDSSVDTADLNDAIKMLDEDHFGLEKVKERIIEYIAVMKLTGKISGSILCLVGPPGVGKTSVGTSVARALSRRFVRMSLGGVKDEAEIRGHRKTYIGAMPGRIIYALKDAKVNNPVLLLDEIDKLSSDLRGDPASALLEVLDPEQNKTFRDRYIEIPFDLSKVLFITTANTLDTIPAPLLDRMEVSSLDGYSQEEKYEIATRFLIPKHHVSNGVADGKIDFSADALNYLIKCYTKEAGVRNLEREIDAIIRKIATEFVKSGKSKKYKVTRKTIEKYLGAPKYSEKDRARESEVGAVNGLAWTMFGGTTLTIEVSVMPDGKGDIQLTGSLGDVMKESARAAISYIRSHAERYGIDPKVFKENDFHIHVPEGATPKDGPSAGVTLATAVLSALTGKKARADVAMTGEVTLLGKVLAIGGLKEKSLAAFRSGIYEIFVPKENEKDLEEIPENVRKKLTINLVNRVDEIFNRVIVGL